MPAEADRRLEPPGHGYPLHLHEIVPPARRPARLDDLVSFHRDYVARAWGTAWLDIVPLSEALRDWLIAAGADR